MVARERNLDGIGLGCQRSKTRMVGLVSELVVVLLEFPDSHFHSDSLARIVVIPLRVNLLMILLIVDQTFYTLLL